MEEHCEFVISFKTGEELRRYPWLVNKLFGVHFDLKTDRRTAQRTGKEWVKIGGAKEALAKAKDYVTAIDHPEERIVFNIPADIISSRTWKQDYVWSVQQQFGAVVRVQNASQLLVEGSQIAVIQAVSQFESYIGMLRQSLRQAAAYNGQNAGYYSHHACQYYQNQGYYAAATIPVDKSEGFVQQEVACRGAPIIQRANLQNASERYQPSMEGNVVQKGSKPVRFDNEQTTTNKKLVKQSVSENQLREYASKLDYTDEEIQMAMAKCLSSPNNQILDENALLQQLIALFPRKIPSLGSCTESRVVKDNCPQNLPQIASVTNEAKLQTVMPEKSVLKKDGVSILSDLRPIVVDGSNVAMSHGDKDVFSCKGIQLCVDYFKQRGHSDITVFVPHWRKEAPKPDRPIEEQSLLLALEDEKILCFTPSRRVNGQRVVCYDDRYIVRLAAENEGVIVSNDNFRDLTKENPEWKKVIDERLLMYTFVKDVFMPPDDPLGRHGPKLDKFLKKGTSPTPRLCPYMKKCTYGNKCKYYHPEKTQNDSVNKTKESAKRITPEDLIKVNAESSVLEQNNMFGVELDSTDNQEVIAEPAHCQQQQLKEQPKGKEYEEKQNAPSQDSSSNFHALQSLLEDMLPDHKDVIKVVLAENPNETDLNKLANLILAN